MVHRPESNPVACFQLCRERCQRWLFSTHFRMANSGLLVLTWETRLSVSDAPGRSASSRGWHRVSAARCRTRSDFRRTRHDPPREEPNARASGVRCRRRRAGIADPARGLSAADRRLELRARLRLSNDLLTIDGMDGRVAIAMEHDGWHGLLGSPKMGYPALPHGGKCRRACPAQPHMLGRSEPPRPQRGLDRPSP
jgi:hypothetical protein